MSKLGAALKLYQAPEETDAEFAKRCGLDAPTLSRILNSEIKIAPTGQWRKIAKSFSGDPERQFTVIAAQLTDYLGDEFAQFVEIHRRVGAHSEPAELPLDDLERALRYIKAKADADPSVRSFVIDLARVAMGYRNAEQGTN